MDEISKEHHTEPAVSRRSRGTGASSGAGQKRSKGPDLQRDLRDFASARPEGWGHDDWLNFLEALKSRGHDIHDREAVGIALEKERLDLVLAGTKGMGPQRRRALVERYGTLWNLRNADVEEIASEAKIPRSLAEQIKSQV
jgi:hypothetical protein